MEFIIQENFFINAYIIFQLQKNIRTKKLKIYLNIKQNKFCWIFSILDHVQFRNGMRSTDIGVTATESEPSLGE